MSSRSDGTDGPYGLFTDQFHETFARADLCLYAGSTESASNTPRPPRRPHRPIQRGGRFSTNTRGPSSASRLRIRSSSQAYRASNASSRGRVTDTAAASLMARRDNGAQRSMSSTHSSVHSSSRSAGATSFIKPNSQALGSGRTNRVCGATSTNAHVCTVSGTERGTARSASRGIRKAPAHPPDQRVRGEGFGNRYVAAPERRWPARRTKSERPRGPSTRVSGVERDRRRAATASWCRQSAGRWSLRRGRSPCAGRATGGFVRSLSGRVSIAW